MDKRYLYRSQMTERRHDDMKNNDNRKYNDRKYDDRKYDERRYNDRKYDDRKYDERKYNDRKYDDRLYDNRNYNFSKYDERNHGNWKYSERKYDEEIKYIEATSKKVVQNDTDEEIKNCKTDDGNKYDWIKFRPILVKEVLHAVLMENLQGKDYNGEECTEWTKTISDEIKTKLKDMGYDRYKFIVQVVIGEQRGEGVKMGCRCFWDSDTDNYAQDIFMNDSLFCVAAAFGVFFY